MNKRTARLRRAKPARATSKRLGKARLSVHRSPRHIYAQIILPNGDVACVASTVDKTLREQCKNGGNVDAAKLVGRLIAERAIAAKIDNIGV